MYIDNQQVLVTCLFITTITVVTCFWFRNKKSKIPTKWKPVGKVSDLHLYPLKSGHRIEILKGKCTKFGIEQITEEQVHKLKDRFLVVYHATHLEFRTARTHPKLVLIKVSNHNINHIKIDAPNMPTIFVKIPQPTNENILQITLHNKELTEIVDCGKEIASWISRFILNTESGLRLGFYDESLKHRKANPTFYKFYPNFLDDDTGFLPDYTSYNLINKTSMKDLNSRLDEEISFCQFRPNILVEGVEEPYVEDSWNWIKIGEEVVFQNIKLCTRCVLTTINEKTGVMASSREPLKTLKTYRQVSDEKLRKFEKNSPVMGIHLGLRKSGIIKVNDLVYLG